MINPEDHDVVRLLILCEQVMSCRIDFEASRNLSPSRHIFDMRQRALLRIDREDGDAVVPTIGGIKELAIGKDVDFGIVVFSAPTSNV